MNEVFKGFQFLYKLRIENERKFVKVVHIHSVATGCINVQATHGVASLF